MTSHVNSQNSTVLRACNLCLPKTRERHNCQKWDFVRIEGASGTPKKGFKIEKVKIHGVGPLKKINKIKGDTP